MSNILRPFLFSIAIVAVFGALLIGNELGAVKPVLAQEDTSTTARFLDTAPTDLTVMAQSVIASKGRDIVDFSDFVDDAGNSVRYALVLERPIQTATTTFFAIDEHSGVFSSTDTLLFHGGANKAHKNIYDITVNLFDLSVSDTEVADSHDFTVTVEELLSVFVANTPTEGTVTAPHARSLFGDPSSIVDLSDYVEFALTFGGYSITPSDNFEIRSDGVLRSRASLRFHNDPAKDTHELTITLIDSYAGPQVDDSLNFTVTVKAQSSDFENDVPTEATVRAPSVNANIPDASIYTAEILDFSEHVDIISGNTVRYEVAPSDKFEIGASSGVLRSTAALRFHGDAAKDTHELMISLIDEVADTTKTRPFTVTVKKRRVPSVDIASQHSPTEAAGANDSYSFFIPPDRTRVGNIHTIPSTNEVRIRGEELVFSIRDVDDGGSFDIDSNGLITLASGVDLDLGTYTITVEVYHRDGAGRVSNPDSITAEIVVAELREARFLDTTPTDLTVRAERGSLSFGSEIIDFSDFVDNADRHPVRYSLLMTSPIQTATTTLFAIDEHSGVFSSTGSLLFKAKGQKDIYDITVNLFDLIVSDTQPSDSIHITVTVIERNASFKSTAPTEATAGAPAAGINPGVSLPVVDIGAHVTRAGHIVSFKLTPSQTNFRIDRVGVLRTTSALRFHDDPEKDTYELTITLVDHHSSLDTPDVDTLDITVTVEELKASFQGSAPTRGRVDAPYAGIESGASARIVDFSRYVDNYGQHTVSYSLEAATAATLDYFEIDSQSGVLRSTSALRFQDNRNQDTHTMTIVLTDEDLGVTDRLSYTVVVRSLGVVEINTVFDVPETQGAGAIPDAVIRFVIDGSVATTGYFLNEDRSGDAAGVFTVAQDGQISLTQAAATSGVLDQDSGDNPHRYTLVVEDSADPAEASTRRNVTLNVTEVNESPLFTPVDTVTVEASGPREIGDPYTAIDPEGTDVSFIIKESGGGTGAQPFSIGHTSGQLRVARGISLDGDDIHNHYDLTLVATDATGKSTEATITIIVLKETTSTNGGQQRFSDFLSSVSVD